jgi:Tfp pilus assembly protein PilO
MKLTYKIIIVFLIVFIVYYLGFIQGYNYYEYQLRELYMKKENEKKLNNIYNV